MERGSARLTSLKGWERAIVNKPNTGRGVEHIWVERGSIRRSSLKGWERAWAIINNTNIGTVSKAMLGKLLRDMVEHIWAFPSPQIPPSAELN